MSRLEGKRGSSALIQKRYIEGRDSPQVKHLWNFRGSTSEKSVGFDLVRCRGEEGTSHEGEKNDGDLVVDLERKEDRNQAREIGGRFDT